MYTFRFSHTSGMGWQCQQGSGCVGRLVIYVHISASMGCIAMTFTHNNGNISTSTQLIATKFGTDSIVIQFIQLMSCNDFGDPLMFPPVPPLGQNQFVQYFGS